MIRNLVKKMQSLNYDGSFIHEYISRLKGIPSISKKHDDSKDDSLAADCLLEFQGSKNQDSESQDSESQDSESEEDSKPVPITSLKTNGFPDRTDKKL